MKFRHFHCFHRFRRPSPGVVIAFLLLAGIPPSFALDTARIVASAVSPNCLDYRVVGICYWLHCSVSGCSIRTSVKVRHYIPDAVVSSYSNTGENPWTDVRAMSVPNAAARAGDVVTRHGQLHVYQPLRANPRDGYWPAGALLESDASTGTWQELTPRLSSSCAVFPHSGFLTQAPQGDYAWALWRPYRCCPRAGQIFLGSTDF